MNFKFMFSLTSHLSEANALHVVGMTCRLMHS